MDDTWKSFRIAAIDALNPLWNDFAKEGRECEVLAPMAQYPNASAWLVRSLAMSPDCITRKLAAMLAGWVQDTKHVSLLPDMLAHERKIFQTDSLSANSVGEDIMFAATRWTTSNNPQVKAVGIDVLANMIADAIAKTHWNTVHWAVANLHYATAGNHEIFSRLIELDDRQLEGQKFFQNAVTALKSCDKATLTQFITPPSGHRSLAQDDRNYLLVNELWTTAAAAENSLRS